MGDIRSFLCRVTDELCDRELCRGERCQRELEATPARLSASVKEALDTRIRADADARTRLRKIEKHVGKGLPLRPDIEEELIDLRERFGGNL
jgi:hypothetical protein